MTTALAVASFALARGLLAGYGGAWFLPVLVREAITAAAPFVAVAAAEWLLVRAMPRAQRMVRDVASVAAWIVLFAAFGGAWVETHTKLAQAMGSGAGFERALIVAGAACGMLAVAVGRAGHAGRAGAAVGLRIATAGWLIVGADLYARLDHVESSRRLAAAAAVTAPFAVLAVALAIAHAKPSRARAVSGAFGALLVAAVAAAAVWPGPPNPRAGASIVLVLVDTLRADALERTTAAGAPLMPRLAEIARSGTRYTQAVSPSPWTLPSVVTVLSAMNPFRHGVGRMHGLAALPGSPSAEWLGPALRATGYQAAAFVNNPWLRPYYGVGRGYLLSRRYHGTAADGVDAALEWIGGHRARPAFVFLHLMDPHWPYEAPSGYGEPRRPCAECDSLKVLQYLPTSEEVRAEVRRRYDAECAYTDAQIGRLWDELGASGRLDDTWLIVTSDHGEELWERQGFLHGHSLFDELLRVPLVVVPPRSDRSAERGITITEQVRLEDVGATIVSLTGAKPPSPVLDGRTLVGPAAVAETSVASVATAAPMPAVAGRPLVAGFVQRENSRDWAVRVDDIKLLTQPDWMFTRLFDLRADPLETTSVGLLRPYDVFRLQALPAQLGLDVEVERTTPVTEGGGAAPALDADVERELRSLGYVD